MIKTDIMLNNIPMSFDNPAALYKYMAANDIQSCKATSTIASVDIFSSKMTLNEVRKWVKMNEDDNIGF